MHSLSAGDHDLVGEPAKPNVDSSSWSSASFRCRGLRSVDAVQQTGMTKPVAGLCGGVDAHRSTCQRVVGGEVMM